MIHTPAANASNISFNFFCVACSQDIFSPTQAFLVITPYLVLGLCWAYREDERQVKHQGRKVAECYQGVFSLGEETCRACGMKSCFQTYPVGRMLMVFSSQSKLSQEELNQLQKDTKFDKKELQQWYKGMFLRWLDHAVLSLIELDMLHRIS
jgi:hypothetical protein